MWRISARRPWLLSGSAMFGVLLGLASAGPSEAQTVGICKAAAFGECLPAGPQGTGQAGPAAPPGSQAGPAAPPPGSQAGPAAPPGSQAGPAAPPGSQAGPAAPPPGSQAGPAGPPAAGICKTAAFGQCL